jgi:hypothetical protein
MNRTRTRPTRPSLIRLTLRDLSVLPQAPGGKGTVVTVSNGVAVRAHVDRLRMPDPAMGCGGVSCVPTDPTGP